MSQLISTKCYDRAKRLAHLCALYSILGLRSNFFNTSVFVLDINYRQGLRSVTHMTNPQRVFSCAMENTISWAFGSDVVLEYSRHAWGNRFLYRLEDAVRAFK